MSNQSVCDMVKECAISGECDQAQPHDCGDYKCDTGTRFCDVHPESRCRAIKAETVTVKPKGSRSILMKDVINENVTLKINVKTLECKVAAFEEAARKFKALPTMRRIVWAVKGGAA